MEKTYPLLCEVHPEECQPEAFAEFFTPLASEHDGFILPMTQDFRTIMHAELDRFLDRSTRLPEGESFIVTIRSEGA